MSSTATKSLKEVLLNLLKNDIDSDGVNYYVGLGRADVLTEPEDISSVSFQRKVRSQLMSVKTLASASFVAPYGVDPSSGRKYYLNRVWDSYDDDNSNEFYVVNDDNEVFICMQTGREADGSTKPSTVQPTSALASSSAKSFKTADAVTGVEDGYVWRFLYPISNLDLDTYQTNSWIPVKTVDATSNRQILATVRHLDLQDSAVHGEIIGVAIDSAGATGEYETAPSITIVGNGTGASFNCDVFGGKITRVRVDSDGAGIFRHGNGYDYANAVLSEGTAKLRPIIAPEGGITKNAIKTLKASDLMLQVDFAGTEFDTILAENDFNQISILRDIKNYVRLADSDFTGNTGLGVKQLTGVTVTTGTKFDDNTDEIFQQAGGGIAPKGKTVFHDDVAGIIYYYQDEDTGFQEFSSTGSLTNLAETKGADFTGKANPDFDAFTGDLLYINNVSADGAGAVTIGITREDTQTEDIRIVLQLG